MPRHCEHCCKELKPRQKRFCSLDCSGRAVGERPKPIKSLAERFEDHVIRGDASECWGWAGSTSKFGYGRLNRGARGQGIIGAHRVSWIIHNGPIPDGLYVLHHCDTPICTNPAHLYLGTQRENLRDAVVRRRGRYAHTA